MELDRIRDIRNREADESQKLARRLADRTVISAQIAGNTTNIYTYMHMPTLYLSICLGSNRRYSTVITTDIHTGQVHTLTYTHTHSPSLTHALSP